MRIKFIYSLFLVLVSTASFGQFRQMYYIDAATGMVQIESRLGNQIGQHFWAGRYDSSLVLLDSLEKIKPNEKAIPVNKMLNHAKLGNTKVFKKLVTKWIVSQDTIAVCTCLEESPFFEDYKKVKWYKKLIKRCWRQKKSVSYSNIKLSDRLMYLRMIDQNTLFCKDAQRERCSEIADSLLKINLYEVISLIDTLNFPDYSEIGSNARDAIGLIVLHSDFDPELQIRFANRMLAKPESYPTSRGALIVDRALSYNGIAQRYGSFPYKLHRDELEQVNRNRTKIGLDPLTLN